MTCPIKPAPGREGLRDWPAGVRPPRQARSEDTLDRILDASEKLLDGRDFEEITVLEIADAAGISVSSLYARFPSKSVLLRCLLERHFERMRAITEATIASQVWEERPLSEVFHFLLRAYVAHRREKQGLLHTFMLAELRDPAFGARRRALDAYVMRVIADFLRQRLPHLAGEQAVTVELAIWTVCSAIQHAVHPPHSFASVLGISDERLVAELERMAGAYLRI